MLIHKKICEILVGDTQSFHCHVHFVSTSQSWTMSFKFSCCSVGANVFTRGAINHCETLCKSHSFLCLENLCESNHFKWLLIASISKQLLQIFQLPKISTIEHVLGSLTRRSGGVTKCFERSRCLQSTAFICRSFCAHCKQKQQTNCHSHWKAPTDMYIFFTSTDNLSSVN